MKKLITIITLLLFSFATMAQAPYVIPRDLRVGGSLKLTAGNQTGAGTMRYRNGHFEFNQDGTWMRYDTLGGATPLTHLPWDSITSKPATFTPAAHNQDWSTVTGKPATFAPAAHNQDWTTITGKPLVFPSDTTHKVQWSKLLGVPQEFTPAPHTQDWSTVTGKPATFTPSAHNQDWSTITGKPTTFTPSAHNQDWNTILNPPATYAPSAHTQDWSTVTGKPSEFTPAAHTQDWGTITGKPATFTPSAHTQSWSTITDQPATYAPSAHTQDWTTVTGKPTLFPPAAHSHANLINPYARFLTLDEISSGAGSGSTSDSTYYTFPTFINDSTHYINPDKLVNGNGNTDSTEWNTWNGITFKAGHRYVQKYGTTWTTNGTLPVIGVEEVFLGAYGDTTLPRPILQTSFTNDQYFIRCNGSTVIKDLDIRSTAYAGNAIRFVCPASYGWVYNCNIDGFATSVVAYRCGPSHGDDWTYLKILYTTMQNNYTDAMFLDNVRDVEIAHCTVRNWNRAYLTNTDQAVSNGDGMQFQGQECHLKIHHTLFERAANMGNKFCIITYSTLTGFIRAEIYKNVFKGNNAPEVTAYYIHPNPSDSLINVYNNVFDGFSNYACYNFGGNTRFYYNIFTNTRIPLISQDNADVAAKLIAFNNIFYGYRTNAVSVSNAGAQTYLYNNVYIPSPEYPNAAAIGSILGTFVSDYNHYQGNVSNSYATLSAFKAATPYEDNGTSGDAMLSNPPNSWRPLVGSPLLGTGTLYDATVRDVDNVLVTNPVSKGLYQAVDPPVPVVYHDTILAAPKHLFGSYATGNYAMFDSTGTLTFHGNASLNVDAIPTLPRAYGNDKQIQYSEGGLLRAEQAFNYDPAKNYLSADTVAVTRLKFIDGTYMSTSAYTDLPAGVNYKTTMNINDGDQLARYTEPDELMIRMPAMTGNATYTVQNPQGYIPVMAHVKANTDVTVNFMGTTKAALTGKVYGIVPAINMEFADAVTFIATNNEAPGFEATVQFQKSPYYVAFPNTPPYLDGLTTGWYSADTAAYFDLAGGKLKHLYDHTGRKALGGELLTSVDFQTWSVNAATPTGALTFNTASFGGVYKNMNLNYRNIYKLVANATNSGGQLWFYNSNNSTNAVAQINGPTTIIFSAPTTQSINQYLYFRNSAGGDAVFVTAPSLKGFTGNHLIQGIVANQPTVVDGVVVFNGTSDFLQSKTNTPLMSMQKIYIVAKIGAGDFKLYTSLTGIGELTAGVLTIGANTALNTFYNIQVKEIVVRNDANVSHDTQFKDYLKWKYTVVEN